MCVYVCMCVCVCVCVCVSRLEKALRTSREDARRLKKQLQVKRRVILNIEKETDTAY